MKIEHVFLVVLLIASCYVFVTEVMSLDYSSWNFTGGQMAGELTFYMPLVFIAVVVGVLILKMVDKER